MGIERTLALVKPDGVRMRLVDKIRQRYINAGLKVVREESHLLKGSQTWNFYKEHEGTFYYDGLVLSIGSGIVHAMILEGKDAIALVRKLNGATKYEDAEPGTIRRDFRSAGGPFNVVHGSDSVEAFEREISIIFG